MPGKKTSKAVRNLYMVAGFSPAEKRKIIQYCQANRISVSNFLANLALGEVRNSPRKPREEEITIKLKVPREQNAKIQMFARRQNKTVAQFFRDLLLPTLKKGKTSFTAKTETLRYYVSAEQHRLIKAYLKAKRLSSRTFISYLALEAIHGNGGK